MPARSSSLCVVSLSSEHAEEIATWHYATPFDRYDLGGGAADLLDPTHRAIAIIERSGSLVGFRTFGPDGQVPGFHYDDNALDTGGGLAPHLVGAGLGAEVIDLGLHYGETNLRPTRWRVTVWEDNIRALIVLARIGFSPIGRFVGPRKTGYQVLSMRARHRGAVNAH